MSDDLKKKIARLPHAITQEVVRDLLARVERLESQNGKMGPTAAVMAAVESLESHGQEY